MSAPKTLGKLALEQFKQLASGISSLDTLRQETEGKLLAKPEKDREIFTPPFYWSKIYELPFLECLAILNHLLGIDKQIIEAAKAPDPQQAVLDRFGDEDLMDWTGGSAGKHEPKLIIGVLTAIMNSLESMIVHCKFLNELVADVRKGQDDAFFKAVRIDRSIATCPTFADRITYAELKKDEHFFAQLSKAMLGKPKRPREEYKELRLALYILEDANGLADLSQEAAYQLFCLDLHLYPSDGEDPAGGLMRFIRRWRKARRT